MKKLQISMIAALILLLAAGGARYYTYAVKEDSNGLTKKDIAEAQEALYSYVDAKNIGEYDTCITGLSDLYKKESYGNDTERILQSYTYESNIALHDFEAEYNADTASVHIGSYASGGEERKEYLADKKTVYFSCDFWVEVKEEGPALSSVFHNGDTRSDYGYLLVKENGDWKIISNGY